jgi:hypothetical protein
MSHLQTREKPARDQAGRVTYFDDFQIEAK